jgi:thioredoxin reductase (NADPH)
MTQNNTTNQIHQLIILGSGPAGYSCAIYSQRAGIKSVMISGMEIGGQLMQTTHVENYPGYESILGSQLMENMKVHAQNLGTNFIVDEITSITKQGNHYVLQGMGDVYKAYAVVIATGSSARWLKCKGEDTFKGFGVSSCATCDGFFYKNQKVAVIGGGNSAIEEALYLSKIASEVILIHRRDSLRGEKIMQDRLFATPNIKVMWNMAVEEMIGTSNPNNLTHLLLKNLHTNKQEKLEINGAFVAIGHTPNTKFLGDLVDLDEDGYICIDSKSTMVLKNNQIVEGLFSAGDVCDKKYKQAITSAGSGCKASIDAQHYLNNIRV